jgi:hypothetical protein
LCDSDGLWDCDTDLNDKQYLASWRSTRIVFQGSSK